MKAAQKKQLIQKASLKCFLSKGYHQTRIEDIIAEASIGKGTFYLYFENKEDLVLSFIQEFKEMFKQIHLWITVSLNEDVDLKDLFKKEGQKIVKILKENRELVTFLFHEGKSISPKITAEISDFFDGQIKSAEKSYKKAQKLGLIKDVNPRYAAYCVVGGISHIYTMWLEGSIGDDIETILTNTLDFYLQALLAN